MMDNWEAYVVNSVANHKEGNLGTYERSLYSVLDGFKQGGSSSGIDLSKGVSVTQAKFEILKAELLSSGTTSAQNGAAASYKFDKNFEVCLFQTRLIADMRLRFLIY